MNKNIKKILIQLGLLILAFVLLGIVRNEYVFTVIVIFLIGVSLKMDYHKNEWALLLLGFVLGFFIEVIMGLFYRFQHWDNASLLGVPIWLPLVWGYAFVLIRRVGALIVK
ncbi:MAG: hypothetical protein A2566_01385 [Candidatus Zambryskibacteria bacterium RIFOXYD1_FULL_40_13]|nr:MAG: hypothetical protein UT25_C0005G0018 [Parcubacteria group bacterium GW2011_GWC1_39_12]KKR19179.1 MAG: hypothetical protein UT49_C0002G0025 [Parcubacteria group bacterium GW2011_GWF1_39_37]KKR34873.1 MAG: hypothetical protein UT68_C0007G0024 [Parcubacteria group bacterium GW2011_GWC2_40_10]KKR52134.1 MAG: hypothetical protein UT89_C0003G0070 [Parcubacteria group bacterium GW2011_GWE1_40_20]KKR66115.1 MAG: hypothetical protein UU06_C0005G0005 [Parcubacteria group bacterium GW2011_GWB1_40_